MSRLFSKSSSIAVLPDEKFCLRASAFWPFVEVFVFVMNYVLGNTEGSRIIDVVNAIMEMSLQRKVGGCLLML